MNKVINQKVDFTFKKDNRIIKQFSLKNRLTNLYLDYVLFRMLPSSIGTAIYPDFTEADTTFNLFSYSYLKFVDTQTIADTDTTMDYDVQSDSLVIESSILKVGDTSKTMTTFYDFDLSAISDNSLFTGVGFGRDAELETDYLFSFIDLSNASIRTTSDTNYGITRYDEITSNELPYGSSDGSYLPFYHVGTDLSGTLESIITCYGVDGSQDCIEYNLADLTLTRLSAGVIEVTGFNNFYIDSTGLFPAEDLYPSNTLYPRQLGQIQSIKYKYLLSDGSYAYTYTNMQNLDISYQDTELKIKLICERGDY